MSWPAIPIRRIFNVVNGGTPTADEINWGGDIPWATPVDIGGAGRTLHQTQRTLTRLGVVTGSRLVAEQSILLSTRAPIGYVTRTTIPMAFNQGCRALVPMREMDVRFFVYQLGTLTDELQRRGQGTTFLELSSEALAALPVTVPPTEEQHRIADFLDTETSRIDHLVSRRRQMCDLLILRRGRVVEHVLRLEEQSEAFVPLKYLAHEITVGIVITPAKWYVDQEGVPALRGVNVRPGRIVRDNMVYISIEGHALNRKSKLALEDVIVVRTGQAGAAAVVPAELDGANCIDLILIRPGRDLDSRYLEHVLNSTYARRQVAENAVGSIQAHFNVGAMRQLAVPSLLVTEQRRLVDEVDSQVDVIDRLMARIDNQLNLLAERRQALITAAVTGQLDVTTARGGENQ